MLGAVDKAGKTQERYEEELLLALDYGLVSAQEATALREEALGLGRSPLELLRARGGVSEHTLSTLREELGPPLEDTASGGAPLEATTLDPRTPPVAPPVAALEDDASEAPVFPVPDWNRYQPVRFLGQGGMGQVFLAYDPLLRRNVALKFVKGGDPELARRFLSEARAQARVRHERVCEVYEVGEVQGRGYIAMRYVDGQPLGQLAATLTPEQKVLVLRQAAEGVHAAHRAGLVHRDIKPGNILVERTEDGGYAPFVMDFGLARDWREEAGQSGVVMGTPHYMAPEQARGDTSRLDRRVDVYGLGATLYVLLTGQTPFAGSGQDVITRLQTQEPLPPRAVDRDIPEDLEAVVLKCLEKERSARYDSARALADDLERFLGGEPVQARRGVGYRLRKKARKHRVALSLAVAALTVVALALGQAVVARKEVAERERLTRSFTERVERIEAAARYSFLSRLHDTREDQQALRASMDALEVEVREAGEHAVGPGHYALGRALLALGDVEGARARLESAWRHGYREPRAAWALALVLGDQYREKLLLDVERRSQEQREARRRELEQRYRDPALAYLRQAEGPDVPAPPLYVKALFAFHEGRHEEALAHLDAMGNTWPWFYEAPLLRGDVHLARATARWHQGDSAGSQADLEAGRRAYAQAISTAESQPDTHYALGRLELAALVMELYGSGDVQPPYERGLAALGRALQAAPGHHRSLIVLSRLHRRLGEQHANQNATDVEALFGKAIDAARAALKLAPPAERVTLDLAIIHRLWARHLQRLSQDPREQLGHSIEAFEQLGPEERDYAFHANLGVTHQVWADYESGLGLDSLEHQGKAIDAYLAAIRLRDTQADAWINLGNAYRARAGLTRAPDAQGDLTRALEAIQRALALNPRNVIACYQGADVSEQLARWRQEHGQDPRPDLERALALYRQGRDINPKLPQLANGLGAALLWWAEQRWEEGEDVEALLTEAREAFEQAREAAPQQSYAYNNLGEVEAVRAGFLLARGQDPSFGLKTAEAAYRKTLEMMPGDADIWTNLARVHVLAATHALQERRAVAPGLTRAQEALDRARQLNPRLGYAWRYQGALLDVHARERVRLGTAKEEDFRRTEDALAQAVALSPRRQEYVLASSELALAWGRWKARQGGDATGKLTRALEGVERILAARPKWARARLLRAGLLWALAEGTAVPEQRQAWTARAREDAEQALASNPHLASTWKARLAPDLELSVRPAAP
ncbi:protein kinase [Myxococcus sp. MISCRS1]|uniref:serine/threonine-protein kinase n=1 Tax=unclassified Myxococcus TaxID=2648731 RepID=UPI001CBC07A8|nr:MULTISPECIES: serine/threonine-protein kinase [unclassified Myxococcus]MBZ4413811.1 protein kinase [Myxococcus sp. XM-1-1-1]MCY1001152.1 protein kinase [Myxococcus sp. MISCRS1]